MVAPVAASVLGLASALGLTLGTTATAAVFGGVGARDADGVGAGPLAAGWSTPACCNHAAVDAFYREGLKARGRDNGPPGARKDYSPTYYAAFLLDPDGNNVEAMCLK